MRRDWTWGWVAALPAIIVAFLAIRSTSFYSESRFIAVGAALALATTIAVGVLWIRNRNSCLKILRSGGDIELVIRPIKALGSAILPFLVILDTTILVYLLLQGPVVTGWGLALAIVTTVSMGVLWVKDKYRYLRLNQQDSEILRIIDCINGF